MERLANGEIDLESIPLDDEATYRELCAGHSVGVFQMESAGMREMMIALQPNSIEDIMALISLYRPGPLDSGVDKKYIARKHGREKVTFEHPALEEILADSYGIMLYQEDVLNVAKTLAGFTVGEADDLRKVMGKKLMDQVKKYEKPFVDGCKQTHNVPESLAKKIYGDIAKYAGYAFNRAHAASYGMVSYLTAYFKTHYPAEYMAGLLTSVTTNPEKLPLYLAETKRLGIEVLPPSVLWSEGEFKVVKDGVVRFGLIGVSGIGPAIVNQMINFRDRTQNSIYGWMRTTSVEVLNKATLEHLVRSGALDELVDVPRRGMTQLETMNMLAMEHHECGVYLTVHPLENVAYILEGLATHNVADLETCSDGEKVKVGGIINRVTKKQTKRGDTMYMLGFEDMTAAIEVLVFPKDASRYKDQFRANEIILMDARVSKDSDDAAVQLFFADMSVPDLPQDGLGKPVMLHFERRPNALAVETISKLIEDHPGDSPVLLRFNEGPHCMVFKFNKTIDPDAEKQLVTLGELLDEPF
jgi:DNA polymerase-3 subunit alpha